jgi:hypothetical protein
VKARAKSLENYIDLNLLSGNQFRAQYWRASGPGLWALYQRRHFRWKIAEIVQLTLGLSISALLCAHLIGERLGVTLYGLQRSYAQALYNFWVVRPDLGVLQTVLLLVAWIHGCIGAWVSLGCTATLGIDWAAKSWLRSFYIATGAQDFLKTQGSPPPALPAAVPG